MKKSIVILFLFSLILNCQIGERKDNALVKIDDHLQFKLQYKFSSEIEYELKKSGKNQTAAWDYSYIGEYRSTLSSWDGQIQPRKEISVNELNEFLSKYQNRDAKEYIIERAKNAKVIIINEAHHQPLHRVFTTELLEELYQSGFQYLGIETLDDRDTYLSERKYPVYQTGYYSKEPRYGELIRTALEIGYEVFPYESKGTNGYEQEIGQAKNIQKKIDERPDGRFLIHCGFSHAIEGIYEPWEKAMAGRLFEFTGIDPLTINQIEFTEKSELKYSHPLLQKLELTNSSVFVDEGEGAYRLESNRDWFDIMVFHPFTKYEKGRPSWLLKNNKNFIKFDIAQKKDINYPILVLAFKESENYKQAIPVDIIEANNSSEDIYLALRAGNFNVIIVDQRGKVRIEKLKIEKQQ